MNIQPREKREHRTDGLLAVHSIFQTIQGEGPFCGTPCVFVRLAGCNLQCPACDTDYTSKRELLAPVEILFKVAKKRTGGLVVVTGGEPFRQELGDLFFMFVSNGYYVQVESNGTLAPSESPWYRNKAEVSEYDRSGVYVVCSPKTGKLHPDVLQAACALKYVVRAGCVDPLDGLPTSALDMPNRPARPPEGWDRPIYVQPLDSKDEWENSNHRNAAVESCMAHGYTLQLQIHKLIGVE